MQQLSTVVLAALGSTLIVMGGYHFFVSGPRLKRLEGTVGMHDGLLTGGGATAATRRVVELESAAAAAKTELPAQAARIAALEAIARAQTPRVGFVRYNAFDDVGSDLSYALALLTGEGNGVVLSSIYSREETRTYGKAVANYQTAVDASREEKDAIARARAAAT